jgi:LysR family hydrogen peroxide-inducible transcriptional activator
LEVENTTKEMGDSPSLGRRITIGAIPTLAPYLLPALMARCKKRHPNLQIDIREDFKVHLTEAIIEGELDLAVVAKPVNDPRLFAEPLMQEPLLLVVGKSHPLANRYLVTGEDLANETFAMMGSSSSTAAQIRSFCGDHHFEPRIGFHCSQISTVKAFVALGAGVSILPRVSRAPEDKDSLVYIPLADASPVREIVIVRHLQRFQSRGSEQLLSLLRDWKWEEQGATSGLTVPVSSDT